mmetsp:Transcript_7277/g.10678  ORF Transcript_7277/g.10678 Transcript_7277/m.10678 type:complete len:130 (-) Transcript_7277:501-890(-)
MNEVQAIRMIRFRTPTTQKSPTDNTSQLGCGASTLCCCCEKRGRSASLEIRLGLGFDTSGTFKREHRRLSTVLTNILPKEGGVIGLTHHNQHHRSTHLAQQSASVSPISIFLNNQRVCLDRCLSSKRLP